MNKVVVQVSDRRWTMQALHLACAISRNTNSQLVLLYLMHVDNPGLLGDDMAIRPPSWEEQENIDNYASVAEDYGVAIMLQPMQMLTYGDAIVQAAEAMDADVLFAHLPQTALPLWRQFIGWQLRRHLNAQGCTLFTLEREENIEDWTPSVAVKHAH